MVPLTSQKAARFFVFEGGVGRQTVGKEFRCRQIEFGLIFRLGGYNQQAVIITKVTNTM